MHMNAPEAIFRHDPRIEANISHGGERDFENGQDANDDQAADSNCTG